jgi:hypothetical protein
VIRGGVLHFDPPISKKLNQVYVLTVSAKFVSDFDPSPCPTQVYEKVVKLRVDTGVEEIEEIEVPEEVIDEVIDENPLPRKIPTKLQESYDLADDIALQTQTILTMVAVAGIVGAKLQGARFF